MGSREADREGGREARRAAGREAGQGTSRGAIEPSGGWTGGELRLGIDLDGVVADFHGGWVERYCADFDAAIRSEQVDGWDSLVELTHFEDDEAFWRWAQGCEPGIFRDLPVMDGAARTLQALAADHRIVIITAKVGWAVPDTLAWLAEHRFPVDEVHFTFDKSEVACDVYLDDSPHHLVGYLDDHPGAITCRMVRPWSEPVPGAVDVHTWAEFAAVVAAAADRRVFEPGSAALRSPAGGDTESPDVGRERDVRSA